MEKLIRTYPTERWAKLECEYETTGKDYYYSDFGRLKSVDQVTGQERLLKGSRLKRGFLMLNITFKGGIIKCFFVHRLIAEKWVERPSEDHVFVIHVNRDVEFNHYKNLQWMTTEEKNAVMIKDGVYDSKNRKRNPRYKLNSSRVKLLKKRLKEGKTKKSIIAKEFGISLNHLNEIAQGRRWAEVDAEA